MSDVRSKNLYELLGNDPELDSDREAEPPTKTIDRPAPRHGKRDAISEAPAAVPTAPRGGNFGGRGRGGRVGGNEDAFRDRNAGSYNNRARPVDEHKETQRRGIRARDDRGARARSDRHSRSGHTDTEKQVGQAWGATRGESEWNDEKAGEAIAKTDENEPQTPLEGEGVAATAAEQEEDKSKSYAEYLAEQAAQRREDLGMKAARAPNEGVKVDKKWEGAKEIKRDDEEESYIKGSTEKNKRERQRKEKTFVDVDMRFVEQPRGRGNGPRGARGGRGGRGGRSDRGDRGDRGDGPRNDGSRGDRPPRGDRPRGDGVPRGGGRGSGRGGAGGPTVDEKNFPSLGAK